MLRKTKSNTAIHGIHSAIAITLCIRDGKVFIFRCRVMRFRGLNVGHESREPTGFTTPF